MVKCLSFGYYVGKVSKVESQDLWERSILQEWQPEVENRGNSYKGWRYYV